MATAEDAQEEQRQKAEAASAQFAGEAAIHEATRVVIEQMENRELAVEALRSGQLSVVAQHAYEAAELAFKEKRFADAKRAYAEVTVAINKLSPVDAETAQSRAAEETTRAEAERVKLTVNLPEAEMATLRKLAARRAISLTDAVRRAIAMERMIEEIEAQGGKLLVEQPDRTMRQLVLR